MWHGCICKGYREFWICLTVARSRCLNVPKYSWFYFNMSEHEWINCPGYILDIWQSFKYASGIKYARVLNMLRYSYNSDILRYTAIYWSSHKRLKNLCNNKVKKAKQKYQKDLLFKNRKKPTKFWICIKEMFPSKESVPISVTTSIDNVKTLRMQTRFVLSL